MPERKEYQREIEQIEQIEREARRLPLGVRRRHREVGELFTGERSSSKRPLVTVFGAGVSGLSAAHELIERGFEVQVVEPNQSHDFEYECEVGGMAANQFGRIKETRVLHPYLFPEDQFVYLDDCKEGKKLEDPSALVPRGDNETVAELRLLRNLRMLPVQRRFGFPWRILFERSVAPDAWLDIADQHLDDRWFTNRDKLGRIAKRFVEAYQQYLADFDEEMSLAENEYGRSPRLSDRMKRREILLIEIIGHTDDDDSDEDHNVWLSFQWASAVRDELVKRLKDMDEDRPFYDPADQPPNFSLHFVVRGAGSRAPSPEWAGRPEAQRFLNRVELRVIEHVMPGDHGYRFFPAFYRHTFDLMKRTPILDRAGVEGPETAFDQLVVPPPVAVALEGVARLERVGRHKVASIEEMKRGLEVYLGSMKLQERDLHRALAQLVKFLTSCPERRRAYENLSWLHFADARKEWEAPTSDIEAKGYSKRAEKLLRKLPQALIAMAAEETDALTHGTISTQLLLDYLAPTNQTDMTLNGPTSLVWLRPWKRYLVRQGVRFFVGSLKSFSWDDDEQALYPDVVNPDGGEVPWREQKGHPYRSPGGPEPPDFYVLALPYETLSNLVWQAHHRLRQDKENGVVHRWTGFEGDFLRLMELDIQAGRRTREGVRLPLRRDESGLPVERFRYPLRDLSGIQFFFDNSVRFGEGHLVFPDAPWGLSSISQPSHWRSRPSGTRGFLGQLSVDIGNLYQPFDFSDLKRPRSAWKCIRRDIANGVWQQVLDGMAHSLAHLVERPAFYYLDQGIHFGHPEVRAPEVEAVVRGAVLEVCLRDGKPLEHGDVIGKDDDIAVVAVPGRTIVVKSPVSGILEEITSDDMLRVELQGNADIATIRGDFELYFPKEWTVLRSEEVGKLINKDKALVTIKSIGMRIKLLSPGKQVLTWVAGEAERVRAGDLVARVRDADTKQVYEIRAPKTASVAPAVDLWQDIEAAKPMARIEFDPGLDAPWHIELVAPWNGRVVRIVKGEVHPGDLIYRIQTVTEDETSTAALPEARSGTQDALTRVRLRDVEHRPTPMLGKVDTWHACEDDSVTYLDDLVQLSYKLISPADGDLRIERAERLAVHRRVQSEEKVAEVTVDVDAPDDPKTTTKLAYGLVDEGKWVGEGDPVVMLTEPLASPMKCRIWRLLYEEESLIDKEAAIAKILVPIRAPADGKLKWKGEPQTSSSADATTSNPVRKDTVVATIQPEDPPDDVKGPARRPGRRRRVLFNVTAGCDGVLARRWSSGESVRKGEEIGAVIGTLSSPWSGTLYRWRVREDERVEENDVIAVVSPAAAAEAKRGKRRSIENATYLRSRTSGRVEWKRSASSSSLRKRPEGVKFKAGERLASVCVPVLAPVLPPRLAEMTLIWSKEVPEAEMAHEGEGTAKRRKGAESRKVEVDERGASRSVEQGETIATILVTVPSPACGKLEQVLQARGAEVHAGDALGRIGDRTPAFNTSAFLINLPGQWRYRPGLTEPSANGRGTAADLEETVARREIDYTVSHDRYVMAGNFMATMTRLSTMESSNESARHAVNAILTKLARCSDATMYNGAGRLFGDYARVWNPERHEVPDLEPLKRLDKALFDAKVPHFIDVLRIPEMIDQIGLYEEIGDYPVRNLLKLLETAPRSFAKEWDFLPGPLDRNSPLAALDRGLKAAGGGKEVAEVLRKLIELCLKPPAPRRQDDGTD